MKEYAHVIIANQYTDQVMEAEVNANLVFVNNSSLPM